MSKRPTRAAAAAVVDDEERPRRGLPLIRKEIVAVSFVALLGLVVRAILIPAQGHVTDVATFEAWMNTLIKVGPSGFYASAGFVDYPPGYMLILWLDGLLYHATFQVGDFSLSAMRVFIKMPAVLADIGIGYITYLLARRIWPVAGAIVAMAVFVLNPASWLVSAYWGQADSVAAVFLVWALYLAVTKRFEFAWLALAFAVLIKPQPLVVAPILLLWQIKAQGMTWRLVAIPVIGALVALAGSIAFAPTANPIAVLGWLYERYHTGIDVYPYNSVNALNLYSINRDFFQSDEQPISLFGLSLGPQFAWGMGIFIALAAATAWRFWRLISASDDADAREVALYSAAFIISLGFFMVVTRQHERYLFSALAIVPLLWNASPLMRLATVILSGTFSYNLFYALAYLAAPSPDLSPVVVHPLSLLNFLTLVVVAGAFLIDEVGDWVNSRLTARASPEAAQASVRRGPNPFEGLVGMTARDYWISGGLTAATAALLCWGIETAKGRIFDEIYYARAAQEYLTHHALYEWTHPPLTKLVVAAGAWFFGLFGYGDPYGARLGNCVIGTLTVPLLYAFAKRLFSSTAAAITSVVLLLTSGYFYVQSRIATPEISVGFFALLTLYCFYRFWTSSQIVALPKKPEYPRLETALFAGGILLALIVLVYVEVGLYNAQAWNATPIPYAIAVLLFGAIVVWSALAWRRSRTADASITVFPDGSVIDGSNVAFPFGEQRALKSSTISDGEATSTWTQDGVENVEGADRVTWRADGTIEGVVNGVPARDGQRWGLWLALSASALACFISSKWDGLFALVALWAIVTLVAAQQLLPGMRRGASPAGQSPRRFAWGNPIAIRLPTYFAASILGVLVIYVLTYAPNWAGATSIGAQAIGHDGWAGLLSLQYQMYHYHATLKATHVYESKWWTWPLELRPVSYYYTAISGKTPPHQVVAEILGVANPAVWLAGIVSIPWAGYLAWRQRHKGAALLVIAYFAQWLPWAASPRIDFLYNAYPNLTVICLCSTYVMATMWRHAAAAKSGWRAYVPSAAYIAACAVLFVFFFPIWSGEPISWSGWIARMWLPYGAPIGWI